MINTGLNKQKKNINENIESLRGYAAMVVVWHHMIFYQYLLDPGFKPLGIFSFDPSGHFCVLVFFMLSGYVIGLSTRKPLTWATSLGYLKKRFVRLYPIFLITLVLALLITPALFGAGTIVGNLILLQGLSVPTITPPGWSLHYEMLYYLLFIFISISRLNPFLLAVMALAIALGNFALYASLSTPPILTSYSYGLIFWVLGLGISQREAKAEPAVSSYQVLFSCLLLLLCVDQFNPFNTLLHKLVVAVGFQASFPDYVPWEQTIVNLFDLAYLPFALLLILIFSGKRVPYKNLLLNGLFACAALNLVYVGKHLYRADLDVNQYALPTSFFLAALLCLSLRLVWLERVSAYIVRLGSWLGALSYGIYLIHYPLLLAFSRMKIFSGTWQTYATRTGLFLISTILLAYFLEKMLQPRMKRLFDGAVK